MAFEGVTMEILNETLENDVNSGENGAGKTIMILICILVTVIVLAVLALLLYCM